MQLLTAQVTGLQSSLTQHTNGQPLKQLKDELSTLKGLLLNRHQFPASPTPGAMGSGSRIPEWQRTQGSKSSTPMKTLTGSQQEGSTPGEVQEVSTSLKGNRDEAAVAGQNSIEVAGDEDGLEDEEDIQPQASDQVTM